MDQEDFINYKIFQQATMRTMPTYRLFMKIDDDGIKIASNEVKLKTEAPALINTSFYSLKRYIIDNYKHYPTRLITLDKISLVSFFKNQSILSVEFGKHHFDFTLDEKSKEKCAIGAQAIVDKFTSLGVVVAEESAWSSKRNSSKKHITYLVFILICMGALLAYGL